MTTDSPTTSVLAGLADIREWQEDFYRNLHQHPELSHQEHDTAAGAAQRLRDFGYDVHEGIGGTGVVGILRNGDGPAVLLRADMDALPVKENTGLPYASTATAVDPDGNEVPVMHACGHDTHVTCLLGAASLLANAPEHWSGTVIALFQPAEELGDGAQGMVDDGLAKVVGHVDVALGQHVFPLPAGHVATRSGPALAIADSMRITVYGRGGHSSMPQATVDPMVLAAMIVLRLQTIVSREVAPTDLAVLTVARIESATTTTNVVGDHAVLSLNLRAGSAEIRQTILDAIRRIVSAECQASNSPKEPEFELYSHFPRTDNDPAVTDRVRAAFDDYFGDRASDLPMMGGSEDFSNIPDALDAPYSFWAFGGVDIDRQADSAGRTALDAPVNHSPTFAPVIQPTLDTGTQALVVAALAWLTPS